jgi:hypothetical protein
VARGYTPIAPARPQFDTDPDIPAKLTSVWRQAEGRPLGPSPGAPNVDVKPAPVPAAYANGSTPTAYKPPVVKYDSKRKKSRRSRRVAVFAVFLLVFVGVLYGTASYMRGRGVLPEIRNPFRTQTATANTDIYLRPAPSTDNDPVGLVTKNSKVRIVNSRDNWYQVDVIEQGRVRNTPVTATRGWLNGKYLDID